MANSPEHVDPGDPAAVRAEENAEYRQELERDLREACAVENFELAFQPKISLITKQVTGFEALVRWHHPVRGHVSPTAFIPISEEIGLIDDIGQWVLQQACREASTWPAHVSVAVNLSPLQLKNASLPAAVAAALQMSGLSPSRLELEITENAVITTGSIDLTVLRTIQDIGVQIVMDDFDVGYSALGRLLHFPFNKIKIDQSFINKIGEDEKAHVTARHIVRAIIGLCEDLNIICTAEGVETEEQLAFLSDAACHEVQGYLIGMPLPAKDVFGTVQNAPELLHRLTMNLAVKDADRRATFENIPFAQITETANDIIIVTTPELEPPGPVITYVNAAFSRLTGYSAAEAIGLTPRILQGPGTSRATLELIKAELRAGRPVHEKILNFGKSGAPYWLDLHIVALRDAHGAITHFAAIERDVTMDKRRLDELEHLADRDTLTGIPNRRAFLRALESEHAVADAGATSARQTNGPCLAFIDIDHFKQVNDKLGHAVGDAVLCGVADCLAENIRRMDILGRLGGEEFAVCMPAVTLQDAKALAERLRCAVAGAELATPSGPVKITVSVGIACYRRGDTTAALTTRADAAMYAAKRAGRNRVRAQASQPHDQAPRAKVVVE
jgi:diguanylate cyclase (GGDEF)-like protein/PAS domain S-box-containing protein